MSVVIAFNGVLRTDLGAPLFDGMLLTRALLMGTRVVIASEGPLAEVERFLQQESISGVSHIHAEVSVLEALRAERVQSSVAMVVTADPADAVAVAEQGVSVCLLNASNFVRPDWKPNRKTWEDIASASHLSRG